MQYGGLRPYGLIVRQLVELSLIICQNKVLCKTHLKVLIIRGVHKLIYIKSYVNGEPNVTYLVLFLMDSKLYSVKEGPNKMSFFLVECVLDLQSEFVVGMLLIGKK